MRGRPRQPTSPISDSGEAPVSSEAQALFESGKVTEAAAVASRQLLKATAAIEIARLTLVKSTAEFETGLATQAINDLRNVIETISGQSEQLEFAATLAMFSRESQFQTPTEVLPTLSRVRQLAARLGSPDALAGLHLAVARLEAYRGHCVDARRHLEIARTAAAGANRPLLGPAINLVDASLETIAGNLSRATNSAKECFQQSVLNGFGILQAGAVTNLGFLALCQLEISRAQDYLAHALEQTAELSFIRLAALDNLLQLALYEDDLDRCDVLMKQCSDMIARQSVPSRSWYDLAHQVTRCSVLAHVGDWEGVIELTNELDRIVDGRQFRSLRVALLCASARALANVGEFERARGRLTAAIHACPRGAVEPLIVLEAATGACLVQMGDGERGEAHFDRALSASRSLGNRFQEQLILRERAKCRMTPAKLSDASLDAASRDNSERSLVLSDVATILGAGSSIDLLAHRAISLVQGTRLESRLHYRSFFEQEFRPEISIDWRTTAEGRSQIELRGSDRLVILGFDSVESLEEVTLIKSLVDLLRAAVRQETGQNAIAGDLDLWPETSGGSNGEAIFGSPRMAEILRVSIRLAATDLPILITGETGTGKDVFARLVHANSGARRGPFVPFNCSSIARDLTESQLFGHRRGAFTGAVDAQPGVIRSASGGTLFLDEIGDMELSLQPKLLRFIESGEIQTIGDSRPTQVKVRLVAATNANLDELSRTGQFRRDLFFRLGAAQIALPPLRERKDEIPALTASFINRFSRETARPRLRVSDDLIAALLLYDWPGNIRQLANEMHRIVAMAEPGQTLTSADLSPIITDGWTVAPKGRNAGRQLSISLDQPLPHAIEELERAFVDRAMQASGGRVAEAAQLLGISRKGLFLKRRRWGHLDPQDEAGVETTH